MLNWFVEMLRLERPGGKYVFAFVGLFVFFGAATAAYNIVLKAAAMFGFADDHNAVMYLQLGLFLVYFDGEGVAYDRWYTWYTGR